MPAAIALDQAGTLTLTGGAGNDRIEILRAPAGGAIVRVNDQQVSFLTGQVKAVVMNGGDGDDLLIVSGTEAGVGVTIDAGAGDDQIFLSLSRPGQVDAIGGLLSSVQAGSGNDSLRFTDSFNTATTTSYSLSSTSLTRTRAGTSTIVNHSGAEQILLQGGSAANTYDVESNAPTTALDLRGGSGDDTFRFGPTGRDLDAIRGTVQVTGNGGSDEVQFDDSARLKPAEFVIFAVPGTTTQSQLTRQSDESSATFTYDTEHAYVQGGSAGDVFAIEGLAEQTITVLSGAAGDDRFEIGGSFQNLDLVRGGLGISAGIGADTLVFDDSLNGRALTVYVVRSSTLLRDSAGVQASLKYQSVEDVQVRGGSGGNLFQIESTRTGAVTTVVGGSAKDQFNLVPSTANLDALKGRLVLSGGAGNDVAYANDHANDQSDPLYQITADELHRYGSMPVQFLGVEDVVVSAANRDGVYEILSTAPATRWTLYGGEGEDEFRFASVAGSLDAITGPVQIIAGGGVDSVTLYDQDNGSDVAYTLDASSLSRTSPLLGTTVRIGLSEHEALSIEAGTGNDRLTLAGNAPTEADVHFDGGTGDDVLEGTSAADNFFFVNDADGGALVPAASEPVTFSSVETLRGGSGNDLFRFTDLGRISGRVEGGAGGGDTLDYSPRNTSVAVDLVAGTATATAGLVGVENVVGSKAADVLNGDDGANLLIGNGGDDVIGGRGGRDVLIGGTGADRLDGGSGEDLLIGGSTAFDGIPQLRLALLSEWQSTAAYQDRVAQLRGTQPVQGGIVLTSSGPGQTVIDDGAADVLTGASDLDWFFVALGDSSDRFKGEQAN